VCCQDLFDLTHKIKFKNLSYSSSLEKRLLLDHICHAVHHNFTTIYHHAAPLNPQKTLKNSPSTTPELIPPKTIKNPPVQILISRLRATAYQRHPELKTHARRAATVGPVLH
jgi:hypothetical protein